MFSFFQNLSMRKKLIATSIFCSVLIGLFISLFFTYHQKRKILFLTEQSSLQIAHLAADSLRNSLLSQDRAAAQQTIEILRKNKNFQFAVVQDGQGQRFAAINPMLADTLLATTGKDAEGFTVMDSHAVVISPIAYRGKTIGRLIIGVSLEDMRSEIQLTILQSVLASLLIMALLIGFFVFMGNLISQPINRLIDASLSIARGDFSRRLAVTSHDEVGRLSGAFNEMSQRLQIIVDELERSEHNYRLHFENVSDLVYSLAPDLKVKSMSPSVEALLGYYPSQIVGKILTDVNLIAPEYVGNIEHDVQQAFGGARISSSEYVMITREGAHKFFETSISPLGKGGKVSAVVCVARDVTERERVLQELRETRDALDNIIESTQDAIVACDSTGHITRVNRYFLDLFGCMHESEIVGQYISVFMPERPGRYRTTTDEWIDLDDKYFSDAQSHVAELLEHGKILNWQTYLHTKKGIIVPVELSVVLNMTASGERVGSVGIMRDVTGRRTAERQLKEAKDFMESLIESSRDGIMISDLTGEIFSVNNAMERITGLPREALVGKHSSMLTVDDREMRRMLADKMGELMEKGFVTFESFYKTQKGKYVELECNSSMIRGAGGDYIAGVSIIRDVTERRTMERQLMQSEKLRSLGELAGGVAHDFNNVLAAILGRTQLLQKLIERPSHEPDRRQSTVEFIKGLRIIEKAALDAAETVRRIQEFSRGRDEDKFFTAVNINEIIDDAIEFTRTYWKDAAEAQGTKVRIRKIDTPLPVVRGSASELREVFTNMIKNSVEAMPAGGEIIIQTAAEPNYVIITFKDTGQGIPEVTRNRIFDPFFTTKGPKSSGLGMSVSYGIINRHQGSIAFESQDGRGTTFLIRLPVAAFVPEQKAARAPSALQKTATILVIDDEKDVRDTLLDILKESGHSAVAANSGTQGLKLFAEGKFDLVFTDLGMPGMSGYQVAEEIKKLDSRVPVFLITGWHVHLSEEQLAASGIDLVLNKPFQLHQVLELVQQGLALRARRLSAA